MFKRLLLLSVLMLPSSAFAGTTDCTPNYGYPGWSCETDDPDNSQLADSIDRLTDELAAQRRAKAQADVDKAMAEFNQTVEQLCSGKINNPNAYRRLCQQKQQQPPGVIPWQPPQKLGRPLPLVEAQKLGLCERSVATHCVPIFK